jgi:hypothetical protein
MLSPYLVSVSYAGYFSREAVFAHGFKCSARGTKGRIADGDNKCVWTILVCNVDRESANEFVILMNLVYSAEALIKISIFQFSTCPN